MMRYLHMQDLSSFDLFLTIVAQTLNNRHLIRTDDIAARSREIS